VQAYIRGFQSEQLGPESVSTMTKHFLVAGRSRTVKIHISRTAGNRYIRVITSKTTQNHFALPSLPARHKSWPYYGMPVGTEYDEVASAFDKGIITDLLRGELGFDGIICTGSTPDRWSFLRKNVIITPRSARRYPRSSMSTLIAPPCSPTWLVMQPPSSAVPFDTVDPIFRFGHGLRYR
jgi:hypothetical protein